MRLPLAIFCIFLCGTSVQAQYGVSNVRDGNGNLTRNASAAARGQGSDRNVNGPTMNVPAAAPPTNPRSNRDTRK